MTSSDDDEDLRLAIELSLQENTPTAPERNLDAGTSTRTGADDDGANAPKSAFLRDRKQLEAERISRLEKRRQRSISPPPIKREPKKPKQNFIDLDDHGTPKGRGLFKKSGNVVKIDPIDLTEEEHDPNPASLSPSKILAPQYPNGVVRKTWVFGTPRKKDIKLEEVLLKQHLKIGVISAFEWDVQWLLRKLDLENTKLYFVMQAKEQYKREQYSREAREIANLRLIFPNMAGQIFCMHSKLMILVYSDFLRVAVPTANMRDFDWGETGIMENSVFLIDLPRFTEGMPEGYKVTRFQEELLHFCKFQDMPENILSGIRKFDFSATKKMAFVHTIGGSHYGNNMRRTGIPGLSKAVRELGLQTGPSLKVDFAISSVGSLNDNLVASLYAAAQGSSRFRDTKDPIPSGLHEKFSIYFPLHETVARSKGGTANGGTNCFQRHYWESAKFPRGCMKDYKSTREGVLSHNKVMFARGQRANDPHKLVAWLYLGSANMSESAWGKVVMDKQRKEHKINCRNWECGVLLPVAEVDTKEEKGVELESGALLAMGVFENVAEPPFQYPGEAYGTKKPWFFEER